jgi:hypothetical protein
MCVCVCMYTCAINFLLYRFTSYTLMTGTMLVVLKVDLLFSKLLVSGHDTCVLLCHVDMSYEQLYCDDHFVT